MVRMGKKNGILPARFVREEVERECPCCWTGGSDREGWTAWAGSLGAGFGT